MKRVNALELVGYDKLNYDLYDEYGNTIYSSGSILSSDFIIQMHYKKIFRKDFDINEVNSKVIDVISFITPEPVCVPQIDGYVPIYSEESVKDLLNSTKNILKCVEEQKVPDSSMCIDASKHILEHVRDNFVGKNSFNNVKVYDQYTFSHGINVATIAALIGINVGLDERQLADLTLGAFLHDIGKMKIPRNILYKPGKLTAIEYEMVKRHAPLGFKLIADGLKLPDVISLIALDHQERCDGSGYPRGLIDKEISLFAQIVSIADVYDALTSDKIYNKSYTPNDAIRIMLNINDFKFNRKILEKFAFLVVTN